MKKIYFLFTALSTSIVMPAFASELLQSVESIDTNTPTVDSGSSDQSMSMSTESPVSENAPTEEIRVTPSISDEEVEKSIRDRTSAIEKATAEISFCKSDLDLVEKSSQSFMNRAVMDEALRNEKLAKYENIRTKLTNDIVKSSQIISELFKSDDNDTVNRINQERIMLRNACDQSLNELNKLIDQQPENNTPLIETKDHYTLEKQPLIETKDHYTLEKQPLIETKDHYTLDKAPLIETKDLYTLEKKSDADDVALTDDKNAVTKTDVKPIDTTALQDLAIKLDGYNPNVKLDAGEIVNSCKRVHKSLLDLKRTVNKRFKKNSEQDRQYNTKLKDVKSFCDNASGRVVKVKFEKHEDIHQVINDVVIDSSHELRIMIDDIVNFAQQELSQQ